MSYMEILMSIIVVGIISASLSLGVVANNENAKSNKMLSKAMEIAKNEIKLDIINKTIDTPDEFIVEKDTSTYDKLIKVSVKWKLGNKDKQYILYGTKPDAKYNN